MPMPKRVVVPSRPLEAQAAEQESESFLLITRLRVRQGLGDLAGIRQELALAQRGVERLEAQGIQKVDDVWMFLLSRKRMPHRKWDSYQYGFSPSSFLPTFVRHKPPRHLVQG